jgi:hypothetical protein
MQQLGKCLELCRVILLGSNFVCEQTKEGCWLGFGNSPELSNTQNDAFSVVQRKTRNFSSITRGVDNSSTVDHFRFLE